MIVGISFFYGFYVVFFKFILVKNMDFKEIYKLKNLVIGFGCLFLKEKWIRY